MEAQIGDSKSLTKRMWAQLVIAKIRRQGWAVAAAGQRSGAFEALAKAVKTGDPENIEAQAARRYWPLMFGPDFRRNTEAPGTNALLNYGYAILRAAAARAIAGAGLHPSIGIFHRHPHNAMPLADDLMEPFRPNVDLEVLSLARDGATEVEKDAKHRLVSVLSSELPTPLGNSSVQTCITRLAQSVSSSFSSGEISLSLPTIVAYSTRKASNDPDSDSE